MLLLSRKPGQSIIIRDDIEVTVIAVEGNRVLVGIRAPEEVPIMRQELLARRGHRPRASPRKGGVEAVRGRHGSNALVACRGYNVVMQPHDGRTTEALLDAGYSLTAGRQWMRRDSCWMSQCRRCLRWYAQLHQRHWCDECYLYMHGYSVDAESAMHSNDDAALPRHAASPLDWLRLTAMVLLTLFALQLYLDALHDNSLPRYVLAALFLLVTLFGLLRRVMPFLYGRRA